MSTSYEHTARDSRSQQTRETPNAPGATGARQYPRPERDSGDLGGVPEQPPSNLARTSRSQVTETRDERWTTAATARERPLTSTNREYPFTVLRSTTCQEFVSIQLDDTDERIRFLKKQPNLLAREHVDSIQGQIFQQAIDFSLMGETTAMYGCVFALALMQVSKNCRERDRPTLYDRLRQRDTREKRDYVTRVENALDAVRDHAAQRKSTDQGLRQPDRTLTSKGGQKPSKDRPTSTAYRVPPVEASHTLAQRGGFDTSDEAQPPGIFSPEYEDQFRRISLRDPATDEGGYLPEEDTSARSRVTPARIPRHPEEDQNPVAGRPEPRKISSSRDPRKNDNYQQPPNEPAETESTVSYSINFTDLFLQDKLDHEYNYKLTAKAPPEGSRGQSMSVREVIQLREEYLVYHASFFFPGRVFSILWHEAQGEPPSKKAHSTNVKSPDVVHDRYDQPVISHFRRMIVIRRKRAHCWCVSISTYGNQALRKFLRPKPNYEEINAHAIAYDSRQAPVYLPGEPKTKRRAIAVKMEPGETLSEASRIHLGRPFNVDFNLRVAPVGEISKADLQYLKGCIAAELGLDETRS